MRIMTMLVLTLVCVPQMLFALHTSEEQRELVTNALLVAVYQGSLDTMEALEQSASLPNLNTWEGFLGAESSEWTMDEKKSAFLDFLHSLGTNNLTSASWMEKSLVRVAMAQCRDLSFTNSVPALKAMALNPHGIYRDDAIEYAIRFGHLDDSLKNFVASIMTNTVSFSLLERGIACGVFAGKVCDLSSATNQSYEAICRQSTSMLYRNRLIDTAGAKMLDKLFCARYNGYSQSSNRLAYACFILDHPNCKFYNKRDFTAITNQLLSSGQPLQQLTIEGEGK